MPITEAAEPRAIPIQARSLVADANGRDQVGGAAPVQTGNLLISNFDGEKIEIRSGLSLWVFADEQFGGTSEARPTLIHPGANASRGGLRISFRITEDAANPFAGVWAMVGPEGLPTDLSAYRGVRFYVRSTDRGAFTAGVVRVAGQLRRYMTPLETGPEWTLVELPFDKFREVTPAGTPAANAPALGCQRRRVDRVQRGPEAPRPVRIGHRSRRILSVRTRSCGSCGSSFTHLSSPPSRYSSRCRP
jgi:hypothetical protein